MQRTDLDRVAEIAREVHHELYERDDVFAERLELFPTGCLVLSFDKTIEGYAFSHPIRQFEPPSLNTLLGKLPKDADSYYLHDLVVTPGQRGCGYAAAGVAKILALAGALKTTSLIAVYDTKGFWEQFGFRSSSGGQTLELVSYGVNVSYMVRDNSA